MLGYRKDKYNGLLRGTRLRQDLIYNEKHKNRTAYVKESRENIQFLSYSPNGRRKTFALIFV